MIESIQEYLGKLGAFEDAWRAVDDEVADFNISTCHYWSDYLRQRRPDRIAFCELRTLDLVLREQRRALAHYQ